MIIERFEKKQILLYICVLLFSLSVSCSAESPDYIINYDVPFYFQWDVRWGDVPYGTGVIGNSGCGPTCVAMVAQYLTNNIDFSPEYVAAYAEKIGCYVPGKGTAWNLFTDGCGEFGISGSGISVDVETMKLELLQGKLIILSMGPGDFTSDGHFIIIRGFDETGFYVNDPNSPDKSQICWSGETLVTQAAAGWSFKCISKAELRFDLLPGLDQQFLDNIEKNNMKSSN